MGCLTVCHIDFVFVYSLFQNTELRQDTPQFKRWEAVPQPLDFKVYIFNVTNPYEVQMGRRPRVVEVGPYVYL